MLLKCCQRLCFVLPPTSSSLTNQGTSGEGWMRETAMAEGRWGLITSENEILQKFRTCLFDNIKLRIINLSCHWEINARKPLISKCLEKLILVHIQSITGSSQLAYWVNRSTDYLGAPGFQHGHPECTGVQTTQPRPKHSCLQLDSGLHDQLSPERQVRKAHILHSHPE